MLGLTYSGACNWGSVVGLNVSAGASDMLAFVCRGHSQHRRQVREGLHVMRLIADSVNNLSAVDALPFFLVHMHLDQGRTHLTDFSCPPWCKAVIVNTLRHTMPMKWNSMTALSKTRGLRLIHNLFSL